jgi:hypothetical protein
MPSVVSDALLLSEERVGERYSEDFSRCARVLVAQRNSKQPFQPFATLVSDLSWDKER